MTKETINKAFIEDIFGIPRDVSNINDDEDDSTATASDKDGVVPFEEKVAEVSNTIQKAVSAPVIKTEEKAQKEKESVPQQPKKDDVETVLNKAVPANPKSTISMFGDIFDKEDEAPKVEVKQKVQPKMENKDEGTEQPKVQLPVEPVKETKVEEKQAPVVVENNVDGLGNKAQMQPSQDSTPLIIAGKPTKHKWNFACPSPKYQRFYEAKREALQDALLKGGELPFDNYYSELENANVDVSVGQTFQAELVCQKMAECQQYRERIKTIQLRVNRQFFQWERHMDLFGGLLSRIEDIRGEDKRHGVRFEHMYDMESYYGELKSLHNSIDKVMRVLDSAFECLSRQVTVTMPMKDVERYTNQPKPMSPALQKFDGLKTYANSSSPMGGTKPKEAGTPAESQPKSGWGIVD